MNDIKISINPIFKKLIPPLSKDEFEQLEQNILAEGKIRDALVLWNGVLIDGHNRYNIAKKHGLEYKTENMTFENEQEARFWIIDNQLGRRNLPPFVRIELAKMKESVIKAEAEKRMLAGRASDKSDPVQKSSQGGSGKSRDEVAAIAGVSHDTYKKATQIMDLAPPEILQDLRDGKTKINTAYNEVVKPRKLSVAEVSLGTRDKQQSSPQDRDVERQIKEQVRKRAEHARTHKRTMDEFHQVFNANAERFVQQLKHNIDFMEDTLWADKSNVESACIAIDDIIATISKLKDGVYSKYESQQK